MCACSALQFVIGTAEDLLRIDQEYRAHRRYPASWGMEQLKEDLQRAVRKEDAHAGGHGESDYDSPGRSAASPAGASGTPPSVARGARGPGSVATPTVGVADDILGSKRRPSKADMRELELKKNSEFRDKMVEILRSKVWLSA